MEDFLKYYPLLAASFIIIIIAFKIKMFKHLKKASDFSLLYYSKDTVEIRKQKVVRKQNMLTGLIIALLISIIMLRFNNVTPFINFSNAFDNEASK